ASIRQRRTLMPLVSIQPLRTRPASRWARALAAAALALAACTAGEPPPPPVTPPTPPPAPPKGNPATPFPVTRETPDKSESAASLALTALGDELKRAMETLGKADPPVHHLAYTVTNHEERTLSASYGAIETDTHPEQRSFDVEAYVGTPSFDSHHASRHVAPV